MASRCFWAVSLVVSSSGFFAAAVSLRGVEDWNWYHGHSTWYGSPEGDGSNGGACGYGIMVDAYPLKARVGAVSPEVFDGGEACGNCYKVRCLDPTICSNKSVTIVVADQAPPRYRDAPLFDLCGAAFGRMAVAGMGTELRNRGEMPIVFRRTKCLYRKNIAFHVNEGSTANWISLLVAFEGGDGDIGSMSIQEGGSDDWLPMSQSWGASWKIDAGRALRGPFSVKVTTLSTGATLIAKDVIPYDWAPKGLFATN
ncbi:unnamed protein product [Cuscuta epithymum]|uniref:Uncharacterized protein n=1 Tax=Cuscuta epithymum TaxID=186058 RepID=A0AAV0EBB2_9ASTE|nr:unnamed protein product [Cuscuta epithymum]